MKALSKNLSLLLASLAVAAAAFLVVGCESSSSDIYGSYYGSDGGASASYNSGYYDPWYGGGYYPGPGYGYGYYGGGAVIVAPPARPSRPHVSPR